MQFPGEKPPSRDGPVRFQCPNCGKPYTIAPEHAGKNTVCSQCTVKFRIPGGTSSSVQSKSVPRAVKSAAVVLPPAPAGLDIYGLDDAPSAAATRGGGESPSHALLQTGSTAGESASEPPLPSRDHYKPLSEKKKKQIAKRSDKLDRLKPSTAGLGVSFGTVLAIALIGWRLYRIAHRMERGAARANAAQSAPEDFAIDPQKFLAEMDREAERMIAQPGTAEAREWLDAAKHPDHTVMEMSAEDARTMVAGFYERGAHQVYVLDPTKIGNGVVISELAIKLSQDPSQRQQCLAWAAKHQEGDQPAADQGQKYLLISTD
jgi:hypothetical protein